MKIKTNLLSYKDPDTGIYTPIPVIVSGDNEEIMKEITELNEKIVQLEDKLNATPILGTIDENKNIILTGNLSDGTYVFRYENTDGTYSDIGSLVIGGLVQYSITETLTGCTPVTGNADVINEGETITLKYVANDGFAFTETVTVSGASYTWDSTTGTLVLSEPTADVTITITATKSGVTNIIDTVGYTDGKRLSTSSGNLSDAEGYTTTGLIKVPAGAVIRTKGVNFNYANGMCNTVIYTAEGTKVSATTLFNTGSTPWNYFTWTFDSEGNMVMNYTGTDTYIKLSGYGSGANLIVTINEEIGEENEDGGYGEPDEPITPVETNQIRLSVDANGNDYVGHNGEDGYSVGYRVNSSGVEEKVDGMCVTGYIPYNYETIRLKNVTVTGTKTPYIAIYKSDKSFYQVVSISDRLTDDGNGVLTGNAPINEQGWIRITCGVIDDTSILTLDTEIV